MTGRSASPDEQPVETVGAVADRHHDGQLDLGRALVEHRRGQVGGEQPLGDGAGGRVDDLEHVATGQGGCRRPQAQHPQRRTADQRAAAVVDPDLGADPDPEAGRQGHGGFIR